jgi:hypothetical protein
MRIAGSNPVDDCLPALGLPAPENKFYALQSREFTVVNLQP